MGACLNLRLHKITCDFGDVMAAFPTKDYADYLKYLDLWNDKLPIQSSLGVSWNVRKDVHIWGVNSKHCMITWDLCNTRKGNTPGLTIDSLDWDTPVPQRKNIYANCGETLSTLSRTWSLQGLMWEKAILHWQAGSVVAWHARQFPCLACAKPRG